MSVENLSEEQVARYGRFAEDPSPQELEEFFRLDEAALEFARTKRRGYNRLGFAVQWGTVRMLGTFLTVPAQVPEVVAEFVAEQVGGVEAAALKQYPDREQTQWDHAREIRDLLGIREFNAAELELRAFVAGRVWVSGEGPRALFDRAVVWLIKHRVLLPGITRLARLVPEVRTGELALINSVIDAEVSPELRRTLIGLLPVPEGARVSTLERWRSPVRDVSGRAQRLALVRAQEVRETNCRGVDLWRVPEVKLAELARFGLATKAFQLQQLTEPRRTATLLAAVRHLESSSVDDALTLFDVLMATKLLARAQRADVKEKLRTWPKLRKAAAKVGSAVEVLLDTPADAEGSAGPVSVAEAWALIEQVVTRQELIEALADLAEVLPPAPDGDADAAWRTQLVERYATVRPFIALLGDVVPWGATEAGAPVIAALETLPTVVARRKPAPAHIDERLLSDGTWRRLVLGNPELAPAGLIDKSAWTFCVLDALHTALKRRDVFAIGADEWGDPRTRLLAGAEWVEARPRIAAGLDLPTTAEEHLGELRLLLSETYRHVADSLPGNTAAEVRDGKLRLGRLEAEVEPAGMSAVRNAVDAMVPRVDFPELLLEVDAHTGMFGAFEHISGMAARPENLEISLTGLLVSKSTNIGLEPVVKPGEPALTRGRLVGADYGYFNLPGIRAASALLVAAQGEIPIARENWGGGLVASADGMRFTVPVRNLHARPNRKYFGNGRGATWLNVVSDRVMGLGGIVMPGTLRDSLGILDAILNLDGGARPEVVITDTASYSDLVFGLFAILGYQFSPRIADISDARLWRFAMNERYGPLEEVSRQRIQDEKIAAHWEDMLRVAGSLQTGRVRAHDLLRMMSTDGRTTGLGEAFAHYGRIFKTLHLLQYVDDEAYRRMIGVQLNIGEARHSLARRIFFGRLGELRAGYRDGMEDQFGALGLALNAVVYWNSLYINAAVEQLEAQGWNLSGAIRARLSPLIFEHVNFHGRYPIVRTHADGRLRALRPLGGDQGE